MKNIQLKRLMVVSLCLLLNVHFAIAQKNDAYQVDVCVYGGNAAGVIAAYSAKKMGKTVLLIEPGKNLGGLSSGGLGFTDIGNKYVVTGLSKDFYRRIGSHYGKLEQWVFEPHVAEDIFKSYIMRAKVDVIYGYRLSAVEKAGQSIRTIKVEPSAGHAKNKVVNAKVFIDCSYEGDLMAKAGITYTVGREANAQYKETYNGVQLLDGHQFPDHIDPYRVKGDSSSGLIWGINKGTLMPRGSGDRKVQSYNYRVCLTDDPRNRISITRPKGYDSTRYELLVRLMEKQKNKLSLNDYFIWSEMPNRKTDINNRNGFSTDMIGTNHGYPDGDYASRSKYIEDLTAYTKGLFYFFGHDQRVPIELRNQMLQWGYPKDEYKNNQNWSPQPYIREARRMVSDYVMTENNCTGKAIVTDGIALAAYNMDSHNTDRLVVDGMVKNEGNVEIPGILPYPISYKAIVPQQQECTNLIVPVCLSASHIAYGSIRMEPVFMVLSQVAAVAASFSIDQGIGVQQLDYKKINEKLTVDPLLDGSTPDLIIDNVSPMVKIEGNWDLKPGHIYGPNALFYNKPDQQPASVTFNANGLKAGQYEVFSYYPLTDQGSNITTIEVFDGEKSHKHSILKSDVKVLGQTSGEWVSLGKYNIKNNTKPYVRISNLKADGIIVADAVLFKPLANPK
ncbi:FAD-dependent oxidoreductase [Pedobacter vanadiisoli]|uniref:FAD-dependent oxidoreductase n=1 Tax=Pedobacter vanadiisoli TaxID=1761975 RepID=A0ABW5MN19_9SPHI